VRVGRQQTIGLSPHARGETLQAQCTGCCWLSSEGVGRYKEDEGQQSSDGLVPWGGTAKRQGAEQLTGWLSCSSQQQEALACWTGWCCTLL